MVDKTISDLIEKTVLLDADLVEIVDSATVGSKKAQLSNIGNRIFTARDTDDLSEGVTNLYYPSADKTKVAFLTVTQAVDLDTMESDITTNNAKVTNATHTGDVTGGTVLTIVKLSQDLDYNSNGVKVVGQTVGGSNGDSVYLSGSNTWSQADASAEATCKTALGTRISATEVLVQGVYTTTGLTAGSLYYVSETPGPPTATIPVTSGSIVRPFAYALTTTELYVFPSGSYVENL